MPINIDSQMSRLCGRLMSCAQNALDTQNYVLEEMEYIADANPDREDIFACIEEIKKQNKASESANWASANHWSEHFDGIAGDKEDEAPDEDNDEDNETTGEENETSIT